MAVVIVCLRLGVSRGVGRGRGVGLSHLAPLQEQLVGLIPAPCRVGRLLKVSTDLPLTFHGMLPAEKSHQEHRRVFEDEIDKGGDTNVV